MAVEKDPRLKKNRTGRMRKENQEGGAKNGERKGGGEREGREDVTPTSPAPKRNEREEEKK